MTCDICGDSCEVDSICETCDAALKTLATLIKSVRSFGWDSHTVAAKPPLPMPPELKRYYTIKAELGKLGVELVGKSGRMETRRKKRQAKKADMRNYYFFTLPLIKELREGRELKKKPHYRIRSLSL